MLILMIGVFGFLRRARHSTPL